jgi:hypothetical protein
MAVAAVEAGAPAVTAAVVTLLSRGAAGEVVDLIDG